MSTQPAPVADVADQRASLFTPGPRLGWVFRDRRQLAEPFPEPRPDFDAMRAAAAQQAESAEKAYRKIRKFLGIPSTLLFVVLLLANGCAANINGSGPPVVGDLIVLVICGPGMTLTFLRWWKARQAAAAVTRVPGDHQRAAAAWQQREEAWQRAELGRLDHVDEWGSAEVSAAAPRVDVFGGSLRGWPGPASLAGGLPFLIVRSQAKEYGTANRLEGVFAPGECVCLVEDVVTSGGAAIEAVVALREAGLRVSNAVCVVDREEGGVDALARQAVRLRPLFTASELLEIPANPHG